MPSFRKDSMFRILQDEPFNGGSPLAQLCHSPITPQTSFFVRSHAAIPSIDPTGYRLEIDGLVRQQLLLSLADLQRYRRYTLAAALQCAGNRRDELLALGPIPNELAWGAEAIGTAAWGGVALADLLEAAGVDTAARHVAFVSCDSITKEGVVTPFGGSIPIEKAMRSEVLLADTMNGEPLSPEHGFPLRVIVPGYIGARSVKWLTRIELTDTPSENYFQAHAYRLHGVADASPGMPLGELSLTSVICEPAADSQLPAGLTQLRGYAMAGGDRRIAHVEVSPDGGANWVAAELLGEDLTWCWRLWRAAVVLAPGERQLVVRARDTAANMQPESLATVWNARGYMNNAWHRVRVCVGE
ncbi:MAG TPA: sulfite oxidase [Roseiflexaceae bacterium]|nr:sulfite oxidase [Roseiflexaceae bacterium]HMP41458.1 sulfite oxidase [Roseiflexaceae bacterium]